VEDLGSTVPIKAGDAEAFDQMMLQQGASIHRLVTRLLGWEDDCDDVVQETFIAAWEQLPRFRGESTLNTWLSSIAINQCRKYRRKKGRWRKFLGDLQKRESLRQASPEDPPSVSKVADIQHALQALSQQDREAIVLCCLENRDLEQVAQMLRIKKNTLEVRLHRARKRLKDHLQQRSNP